MADDDLPLAAATPLTPEEKAKKIRNLEKKLRQIADIRDKQSRGEKIDAAQVIRETHRHHYAPWISFH